MTVHLRQEQQTMLWTLAMHAHDAASRRPILGDRFAADLLDRVDDQPTLDGTSLAGNTPLICTRATRRRRPRPSSAAPGAAARSWPPGSSSSGAAHRLPRRAKLGGGLRRPRATFPAAVRENEEVVPVNASTWALPSGVTAGR